MMSKLPEIRVSSTKPTVYFTGVDYIGPLLVKQKRNTLKRYGWIFTCLSSRAVYIEVVPDMSSSSFINAVKRFIGRRGKPCKTFSDNSLNFVGAEKKLRESLQSINCNTVRSHMQQKNIQGQIQSTLRQPCGRSLGASN